MDDPVMHDAETKKAMDARLAAAAGRLMPDDARHHLVEGAVERLARRSELLRDILAGLVGADHPPHRPHLPFDARQARSEYAGRVAELLTRFG